MGLTGDDFRGLTCVMFGCCLGGIANLFSDV